jgi:predicted transcriptional regulator
MADLVTPMAIRVAATLRVADRIADGSRTPFALAEAVGAAPDALDRLLRHLVDAGLFERDDAGAYTLTSRGEALRDDDPSGTRAVLDIDSAIGRADLSFVHLLHSIRTGQPAYPRQFGRPFWEDLASDPARTVSYDAQMGVDVARWAPSIVGALDWGELGHVVDVGGGNGTLLVALLRAYPALRGTVVDQPQTIAAARESLARAGLSERGEPVAGSFFDPLPPGAGGYLLCAILHDWDDRAAGAILRRCADAAGRTGRVFVVEKTGSDGASPRTDMDLRVLVYLGGRERGIEVLTALAAGSGLRVTEVHPAGDLSVVELGVA